MSATSAPPMVNAADFRAFREGDERALERIFTEWYPALVEEATRLLTGDGAAGSRAVQGAFAQAWEARSAIADEEALVHGLRAAVHDESLRILSRLEAAHRLDQMEGGHAPRFPVRADPGVDAAWRALHEVLHIDPEQVASEVQKANARALHQSAAQLGEMASAAFTWKKAAALLAAVAALGAAVFYLTRDTDAEMLAKSLRAPGTHVSTTAAGELSTVRLPDGSTARLGPASSIVVPGKFGTTMRGLEVNGTADFTVASAGGPRFLVKAGPALVAATGTEFVVRRYADEQTTMVFVREGEVAVSAGDSTRHIGAGEAVEVTDMLTFITPDAATVEEMVGWRDSTLVFTDRPLGEMLAQMQRWFGVKLRVSDSSLLTRPVTMRVQLGDYDAAMTALQKSAQVKKVWKGEEQELVNTLRIKD